MVSSFTFNAKLVLLVMCILLSPHFAEAHGADLQEKKHILLEAHYSARGMLSWVDGEHLIAKIYSDGVVEYEDVEIKNGAPSPYLRRATLSRDDLNSLSELLKSSDVQGLSSKYAAFSTTIDHSEDLLLKITTGNKVKEIMVENFKPDLPEASAKYPKALIRVACWAELARKNAQARFFFRESIACCK